MIGHPLSCIIPEDRHGEPTEVQARIESGESVVRYESVRIRKDGTLHSRRHGRLPSQGSQRSHRGQARPLFGTLRNAKSMEDAQRRSEARFRSFVENAPYGILRTTPEGRIVQANPALVEMLGYASEQEMLGLNMGHGRVSESRGARRGDAMVAESGLRSRN